MKAIHLNVYNTVPKSCTNPILTNIVYTVCLIQMDPNFAVNFQPFHKWVSHIQGSECKLCATGTGTLLVHSKNRARWSEAHSFWHWHPWNLVEKVKNVLHLVMAASSAGKDWIVSARLVSCWSLRPPALGLKIRLLYMPSLSQSSFGKVWISELFSSSCCSMSSKIPAAAGRSWAKCHMLCFQRKEHPAVTQVSHHHRRLKFWI